MEDTRFAVIGVGKYGNQIALKLAHKGAEVLCFDVNEENIERIKDDVAYAVTMDCTDKKNLLAHNLEQVDAAVVAIGENFEATILTSVHLLDLGIKRVIARASGVQQKTILEKIGITEILAPENEVAEYMVETLMNPSVVSVLQLADDFEIAEIKTPKKLANRTLKDVGFSERYKLTLVTIKREFNEKNENGEDCVNCHIVGVLSPDTMIKETDKLVVFGTLKSIERLLEINQ